MSIDLTGITNKNEYYTNHYFATVFEENASAAVSGWNAVSRETEEIRTPWSLLRQTARQYYAAHDRFVRSSLNLQVLSNIRALADSYLASLGYPEAKPEVIAVDGTLAVPVYLEMTKRSGAPLLWVILSASKENEAGIMESNAFNAADVEHDAGGAFDKGMLHELPNEDLAARILFGSAEPPRFLVFIGMNQIALIDRSKWNEKRYLQFELEEIFARLENTTLQAMAVLLHRDSLCPEDGKILLDELDEQSQKNASGVSQNLKYALRESIELLGNEVLYDMTHRLGRDREADPVDADKLTLECLRYMYRMLFVLFIESRPELGYAPIKAQVYYSAYSLESLRDIADNIRDEVVQVGNGYYLHDTLQKLYELIYAGYPKTEEELRRAAGSDSLHDMFLIAPLKAHIFDREYTPMITAAKLRNSCMLRIIDLMSLTRPTGKKNDRRGRISYANLGINQMGAAYEALLSYRGFIAGHDLYEVKRAGDSFDELDVGYFVPESQLDQYTEDERVRYESGDKKGKLRMYEKGTFIYRLAGREREKSASYYTPEVLTKCLVKYALKELLEGKTADEILNLTICEPAMGSAAFLNEAINQLAEAYIARKEKETGDVIHYEKRFNELQKVKMYIADRNVYGIDLNPIAVELAEVSLWLNTIFAGGFVPWFGTQLVNGNSLIGARRQCYRAADVQAAGKGQRWYENAPERAPLGAKKMLPKRIFHFLLGDPGMCSYTDKVIRSLEPANIKQMADWNKRFIAPYSDDETETLLRLSQTINALWKAQIKNRKLLKEHTRSTLSVYGRQDTGKDSMTSIREKDKLLQIIYKSEHAQNAGPYARLKFAMDYWCALWFWPIEQTELLPSRSEFLNDMHLILVGVMQTQRSNDDHQVKLFEERADDDEEYVWEDTEVNLDQLCQLFPRLALVRRIAAQNKFMHWELEFADLFAERGGFDLILGNPPWVKITWEEKGVLSDEQPLFAVRKLSAAQTTQRRQEVLKNARAKKLYFSEYEAIAAAQNYINATQNYASLKGLQGNLYECFLPQSWTYCNKNGIFALIHPESVFTDSKGTAIRRELNARLRKHFKFSNALKLFADVHTSREYGLNVYSNEQTVGFDQIVNLYVASTVDECYENDEKSPVYIRDKTGKRNLKGQRSRITSIGQDELKLFARILDHSDDWASARLMSIYAEELIDILLCFDKQKKRLIDMRDSLAVSMLWDETNAQKDGTIERKVHFGECIDTILSGAHIGTANPLFNCSNRACSGNNDNASIDLTCISAKYIQRCNYAPACDMHEYLRRIPDTAWGNKYTDHYRIVGRKMIDIEGERTLMAALLPPRVGHTNGMIGFAFADRKILAVMLGAFCSLPYDFFIKVCGKGNLQMNTAGMLPVIAPDHMLAPEIICRAALLNCLTAFYADFWDSIYSDQFRKIEWTKSDERLKHERFISLAAHWTYETAERNDYCRRQLLVEIDVLVAMALGMSLRQLLAAYRIQFPILQQHEKDTYYDRCGTIVFAKNNALTGVGFDRKTWETQVRDAPAGKKFYRTITDDTMPGGPAERTIAYVAPFDRCDRERDYETAWNFFAEKYGKKNLQYL